MRVFWRSRHSRRPRGHTSQIFPGMGDEFNPFLARRDEASNGQQVSGDHQGIVTADPSTSTTVTVELQSTQGQADPPASST